MRGRTRVGRTDHFVTIEVPEATYCLTCWSRGEARAICKVLRVWIRQGRDKDLRTLEALAKFAAERPTERTKTIVEEFARERRHRSLHGVPDARGFVDVHEPDPDRAVAVGEVCSEGGGRARRRRRK